MHICAPCSQTYMHTRYIPPHTCSSGTHINTHMVIHRCTTTYKSTQPHLCTHASIHAPIFAHCTHSLHVHMHTPKYTDALKHVYTRVVTHICTLTYLYTHIPHVHIIPYAYYICQHTGTYIDTAECTFKHTCVCYSHVCFHDQMCARICSHENQYADHVHTICSFKLTRK